MLWLGCGILYYLVSYFGKAQSLDGLLKAIYLIPFVYYIGFIEASHSALMKFGVILPSVIFFLAHGWFWFRCRTKLVLVLLTLAHLGGVAISFAGIIALLN